MVHDWVDRLIVIVAAAVSTPADAAAQTTSVRAAIPATLFADVTKGLADFPLVGNTPTRS